MERLEFEHLIRPAAGDTGEQEFIVIGSQSIFGAVPEVEKLAPELLRSMELDLYLQRNPAKGEEIDGVLGSCRVFITRLDIGRMGSALKPRRCRWAGRRD
jgi:hypothetical protein